jgi:8-oxo-dGTP pyrophosphatase MutT (NUDIX family)
MLHTTLCFLIKDEQVLLGLKKRRFGTGKWNGAGGKLLEGESVIESVAREVNEELGVVVLPEHFESVATLHFNYTDNPDWTQECGVFIVLAGKKIKAEFRFNNNGTQVLDSVITEVEKWEQ